MDKVTKGKNIPIASHLYDEVWGHLSVRNETSSGEYYRYAKNLMELEKYDEDRERKLHIAMARKHDASSVFMSDSTLLTPENHGRGAGSAKLILSIYFPPSPL
ncbi:hypothetical protein PV326_002568 [Microctonus aethiopoides]|nr:hypothetical protein PV326_002568 [Microctonus aethiopoides]